MNVVVDVEIRPAHGELGQTGVKRGGGVCCHNNSRTVLSKGYLWVCAGCNTNSCYLL